jgi:hypothetical protein
MRTLRWAIPIAVVTFLAYYLTQVGWTRVWNSRPTSPGFYLVLFLQVLTLPVFESIIYGRLWSGGKPLNLSVLLRKQYLNGLMVDYSGEAYLYLWAKRTLKLPTKAILHAIKDSNVLSAAASLVLIWPMLLAFAAGGGISVPALKSGYLWALAFAVTVPLGLSLVLVIGGRRVSTLSRMEMAATFSLHLLRSAVQQASEFALWWFSGAVPSAITCLQFVALQFLISRLPLVANKNLLLAGAAIIAAGLLKIEAPPVAAVILIRQAFGLLAAFAVVGVPAFFDRTLIRDEVDPAAT